MQFATYILTNIITADIIIIPRIMIPYEIMLTRAYRRKTDTAAAMPVITALFDVNAELCAQNVEGAVLCASFEEQLLKAVFNLNIAATSV